jgi:tetratricopeptide (TPR) repeat protein
MKTLIFILSILVSLISWGQTNLEKGNLAFEDEQYEIAIQNYMEAISNEEKSSELFYNLGNSYFKTNEIGEAIWAYEQAAKIDPSDKDIQFNVDFTNNLTVDKLNTNSKGIGSWLTKNIYRFSPNFWFYSSLFSALLTAMSIYFFFTPTTQLLNNLSLFFGSLFGLILAVTIAFSILHKSRLINNTKVVIVNSNAKILTTPSLDSPTSFELHEGAQLEIKSSQDEWYEVSLNSNEGWILKENVWVY